ncbi:MAG TPA: porin [Bacteroidales bacterium]|nr:porin [Bacteroidales bacterium]HRZ20456.1 porin [Bacteroidales bacterium]
MKNVYAILILLMMFIYLPVDAQVRTVTGKVTSNIGQEPVKEASVSLKGTDVAVKTDENGMYSIQVSATSSDVLVFTHPDHDKIEIGLNNRSVMDIMMIYNVRYNQYGVRVNRNPLFSEERNGILVFESYKNDYRFWFDFRVQADGAWFFGDVMNPIGNGYSIRRARLAGKVEVGKHWYGELDLDFSNSELELNDAYLEYTFNKGVSLRVGNFKEYYSMERTTTSRYVTFIERPNAVNAFAPSRHIGVGASYNYKWLLMQGGVFFQTIGDVEERIFSEDNNKDYGMDEGYSLTGRLVLMGFHDDLNKRLHLGISGSYRTPKTDAEVRQTLRYSTRSLTSINRKKYMDTDLMGGIDHATLGGLEVAAFYKGFRIQGEYLMSGVHDTLGGVKTTNNFDGFYVFGSCLLFGGKYNYNNEDGEFTQVSRGKKWGDIELALRYDYLSLNGGMDKIMGGAGEGYTFGLNYHITNNVKIMFNYAYLNHDRYANGKGKLYVGYDADGNLTKDPKQVVDEAGKAGEDYHMVSVRFEIDF